MIYYSFRFDFFDEIRLTSGAVSNQLHVLIMKSYVTLISSFILICTQMAAQDSSNLPYYQIPDYPETYSAGNVVGRLLDGLGFRYYWATEGLTKTDLEFRPSEEARTSKETLDHIYGLSMTIINSIQSAPNLPREKPDMSFDQMRRLTLENIGKASQLAKGGSSSDLENYRAIFNRENSSTEYPFWNMLNGPIADAIYHTGQVVSFRRSSGNPIPPGVRFLAGKMIQK